MGHSSKLIEDAVESFASLPGIGRKTALRLALHLLKKSPEQVNRISLSLQTLRNEIKFCKKCHFIADTEACSICTSTSRDQSTLCVVEGIRDVMAIEETHQFGGVYHVLGGRISPINGVNPTDLNLDSLFERLKSDHFTEVILGLSPTMDGDSTAFYIARQLEGSNLSISSIARGVSFGGELEYADEVTLGRAIESRLPYAQ